MKNLITICATGSLALTAGLASAQTPSNFTNALLGSGGTGLCLLDGGALNGSAALQVFGNTQALITQDFATGLLGLGPSAGKGNASMLPTQADALTRLLDNPGEMDSLPGLDSNGLPGLAAGNSGSQQQGPQALIVLLDGMQHNAPGDGNGAALPQDPAALIALLEGLQNKAPGDGNASTLPQNPQALITLLEGMQHNTPGNDNAAALPQDPAALVVLLDGLQNKGPGDGNANAQPQGPQALIALLEGMQNKGPGDGNANAQPQKPAALIALLDGLQNKGPGDGNANAQPQKPAALIALLDGLQNKGPGDGIANAQPQGPQALIVLVDGLQHMAPGGGKGDNNTGITSGGSVLGYAVIDASAITASFGEATAGNVSDNLIGGLVSDTGMGSARDGGEIVGEGSASAAMGLDDDMNNSPSEGGNGNKMGARTGRTEMLAGTAAE